MDVSYSKTEVSNLTDISLSVYDTHYTIHNVLRVHKVGFIIYKTVIKTLMAQHFTITSNGHIT